MFFQAEVGRDLLLPVTDLLASHFSWPPLIRLPSDHAVH